MIVTMPPTLSSIATRANTISWAVVAMLRDVFRRSMLSGVHGRMRTDASHFRHTSLFQSEHGVSFMKDMKRITIMNQG